MFQGTIPPEMRSIVAEHARAWPRGADVYVGCSGNLTIERTLSGEGFRLHSNDVNPYSCALGWHFAGERLAYGLKEESRDQLGWIEPYLDGRSGTLATLMLGTRFLHWVGRDEVPYYARMVAAHRDQFPAMHAATVAKINAVTLNLASFSPMDVLEYLENVPYNSPVAMFPPFWCLSPNERILTADFRWVPCGDLVEGQEIVAFDEFPTPGNRMRRWRYATITRSQPAVKDCVRVHLENGDSIVCTADHPWLAARTLTNPSAVWTEAADLTRPSKYQARGDQPIRHFVYKAVEPWTQASSFEDGWLSGMLDGEGTIMMPLSNGHGSAKVAIYQTPGRIADEVESVLRRHGFGVDVRLKTPSTISKKPVNQIFVSGGFPEILRVLGTFRPMRLIDRLRYDLDISLQSIRVNTRGGNTYGGKVRVEAVEHLGPRDIQSISTSTGTYVGEGYLMHNSGGYETMFAGIEKHFDWPEPTYPTLDEAGKQRIIERVVNRPYWLLGLHYQTPELEPYRVGYVKVAPRAMPIWVYARPGVPRIVTPSIATAPVLAPKLGRDEELGDRLSLHPLTAQQFNGLRSQFLDKRIPPGLPSLACAVACDGKIIGAFGWLPPKFDPDCAYLMSDFPISWSAYTRLSKLIVMAALSIETRQLLQRSLNRRLTSFATTAFTDRPTSGKYGRGIPGVKLVSRKPCEDGEHAWQLQYGGPLGAWTLAEALSMWRDKHGGHRR